MNSDLLYIFGRIEAIQVFEKVLTAGVTAA